MAETKDKTPTAEEQAAEAKAVADKAEAEQKAAETKAAEELAARNAAEQATADQALAEQRAAGKPAPKERVFIEDKVYLRGPNGVIYDYEQLVANQPGFVAVVPNKSKAYIAREKKAMGEAEPK